MNRLQLAIGAMAFAMAGAVVSPALAQDYPTQPIRLLVPYQPGGGTDITARLIGPQIAERLGQPVVVENMTGAAGMIAIEALANSAPDGYTILIDAPGIVMNPSLFDAPYDPLEQIQPVAQLISLPFVLVTNPSVEATTPQELIDLARDNPGALNVASSGTSTRLAGELFGLEAGINFTFIPYRGSAPASASVVGGETELLFSDLPSVAQHIESGRVVALGVSSPEPAAGLPGVPPISQAGLPDYSPVSWYGIFAPAGTPADVVQTLNETLNEIMQQPDMIERMAALGGEPVSISVEEFTEFYRSEIETWAYVVEEAGIEMEP